MKFLVETWPKGIKGNRNAISIFVCDDPSKAEELAKRYVALQAGKAYVDTFDFHATLLEEIPVMTEFDIEEMEPQFIH